MGGTLRVIVWEWLRYPNDSPDQTSVTEYTAAGRARDDPENAALSGVPPSFHLQDNNSGDLWWFNSSPVQQSYHIWILRSEHWMNSSNKEVNVISAGNSSSWLSQWISGNLEHFLMLQNLHELWSDASQVIGHDERSGEHCPETHLSSALLKGQSIVTYHQHVRVIPASWSWTLTLQWCSSVD